MRLLGVTPRAGVLPREQAAFGETTTVVCHTNIEGWFDAPTSVEVILRRSTAPFGVSWSLLVTEGVTGLHSPICSSHVQLLEVLEDDGGS